MAMSTVRKMKHEMRGQDANKAGGDTNKAWGEAKCFIGINAVRQML